MKLLGFLGPLLSVALWFGASASAQTPHITSIVVNGCTYTVGVSTTPCKMGPGMTLVVNGTNFSSSGIVGTCDCPQITVTAGNWTSTKVTGTVNWVTASASINLETSGGSFSDDSVPYTALAPVITSITVGTCTYTPNVSPTLCVVTAGTQVTIHGDYFGPGPGPTVSGPQASTCDCASPTINSWDPNWSTSPSPTGNTIVLTAVDARCGSTIAVDSLTLWSNPVPYTTCSN